MIPSETPVESLYDLIEDLRVLNALIMHILPAYEFNTFNKIFKYQLNKFLFHILFHIA